MGIFDTSHKINYQKGLVDKDTILDLISQVEKFPDEEYGDFGEVLEHTDYCIYTEIADAVINADVVEAIPKADYETQLKADMVAMLRFLWNDIEDLDAPICDYVSSDCISKWQVHELIQQKIKVLKENTDDN